MHILTLYMAQFEVLSHSYTRSFPKRNKARLVENMVNIIIKLIEKKFTF